MTTTTRDSRQLSDVTTFRPDRDVLSGRSTGKTWHPATRVAFRLCFVYLGLYIVSTQLLTTLLFIPRLSFQPLDTHPPLRSLVVWTATHVFHLANFATAQTGSSDRPFDWVEVFCFFCVSVAAATVWSILDRERANYDKLNRWFRLFVRFALAATMIEYGSWKVLVQQMPPLRFSQLVQPMGAFSPEGLLWAFMGAAPAYESATGVAEVLAGVLMFVPRTATLGTLICLADLLQVFLLNMTYDVPVKLMSFHLILLALFLLAPYARRFGDFLVMGRYTAPAVEAALFAESRKNLRAISAQIVVGAWLTIIYLTGALRNWTAREKIPKGPFQGVWNVTAMSVDGVGRPPLLTDSSRWRRVVFDGPQMVLQGMDERPTPYTAAVDPSTRRITLGRRTDKAWKAQLTFGNPAPGELRVEGDLDGHHVQAELARVSGFLLVDRGFHWVQERPLHR